MICIINYGMGNLGSIVNMFGYINDGSNAYEFLHQIYVEV